MLDQTVHEVPRVEAGGHGRLQRGERGGRVTARDGVRQAEEDIDVGYAKHPGHVIDRHRASPDRHHLVEQAHGVTHASVGTRRDQLERTALHLEPLRGGYLRKPRLGVSGRDPVEIEGLAARGYRLGDLAGLRRCHDEDHVRRRLFQRLQQRVERLAREHVRLVDDIDLHAARERSVLHRLPYAARVLDLPVGGAVYLDDVEALARRDLLARNALSARLVGWTLLAVESLGQYPCDGRLADSSRPGEEIRVSRPIGPHRRCKCQDDVLLTDHVREGLGSPFSG